MLICGLNKTTLLDYPGRVAATVFTGGCNFRCPFCHNAGLVLTPSAQEIISEEEVFSFLKRRKNIIKGVCITGGEPTLQKDLPEFISRIKEQGFLVKLDSNGYQPEIMKQLIEGHLLDYVAMDIKNCREKYAYTAGFEDSAKAEDSFCIENIVKSVDILMHADIEYEFRTTVVKEFHTKEDFIRIGQWLGGCKRYYLQQYMENDNIIAAKTETDGKYKTAALTEQQAEWEYFHGYEKEELEAFVQVLREIPGMTGEVKLRGIE